MIHLIKKINGVYPICIGVIYIILYNFTKLSNITKLFVLLILFGKIKLLYDYSKYLQYTLLDIIKLYKPLDIDMDIVYLIYKNRENPNKIKQIYETNPEVKLLFTKPIKHFIMK